MSDKCLFIGYPKKTKRYYFYLTKEQKMFVSNRTIFLKKIFFRERTNASKIKLDKVHEVEESAYTESNLIEKSNSESVEASLRRSDRVPHQLDRYNDFLV